MKDSDCLLAYVTMPDRESAGTFCETLVRERLAACANIVDRVSSIYWWQGELENEEECACLFKTTRERFPAFKARAMETHPYDVPCIVAWPLAAGNDAFFNWIRSETTPR